MAAGSPFFSIFVPTRNRPILLRRALESIATQTSTDYEVLVVDDGSTAEHAAGLRALQSEFDSRFVFLFRDGGEYRHGPGVARNAGIERARGRFVGFLDDDDYWCDREHLARAGRAIVHQPDADLYIAGQIATRGDAVVVSSWLPHLDRVSCGREIAEVPPVRQVSRRDVLQPQGIGFAHVNMCLARRETVVAAGGFWSVATYEEDLDFFLRLVDLAEVVLYCPAVVSVQTLRETELESGASSISDDDRALLRIAACQHALLMCRRPEARAYARLLMAGAMKALARRHHFAGNRQHAADLALQAVGACPSLRWMVIAAYLQLRSLFDRCSP